MTIGAVSVRPYPWMTANPSSPQNASSSASSGAAPTMNAQNFSPNIRWTDDDATSASRCACPLRLRACVGRPGDARSDVLAQHIQDLRDRHQHRHAPRLDLLDDLARVVSAHEDDDAGQHRRNERRHGLAEHVAERQQVQEANREERRRPFPVLQHLAFDRHDVGEHVAVRDDHAFRFGCRARREDDLRDVVPA